ncbi:MAG: hypothetical protein LBB48_05615 [Treponema sp.]|jgi:hypothetical protein|nr:hypothetical protein [Treponema sp.]
MTQDKRIIVICFALALPVWAEDSSLETHTDLSLTVSSLPEAQAAVTQSFVFPFLQGEGPLVSGNNVTLKLGANVSPVSFNILADTVWMPIAFFTVSLGAKLGSGWNYPLFGAPMKGMGVRVYQDGQPTEEGVDGAGLDGVVWNTHAGATVQFDLAALFPGDWRHVVMQVYNEISFQNYTGARGHESWYYEGDDGVNQNAFSYYFSALLGYQMPLFIDLAGVMVELREPFYNPYTGGSLTNRGPETTLSLAVDFKLPKNVTLMLLGQWKNKLLHPLTSDYSRRWDFFRAALIATCRLR